MFLVNSNPKSHSPQRTHGDHTPVGSTEGRVCDIWDYIDDDIEAQTLFGSTILINAIN